MSENFTTEERAAMKERAQEVRKSRGAKGKDQEPAVLEKIAEMEGDDRALAERVHAIVKEVAPEMVPRLWYGMPAYGKGGKATLFFQAKAKFKARYATLGCNEDAQLDDGAMWPTAFAVTALTPEVEARIADLVKRAAG
ncbi:hypothetical protein Aab01nite_37410 [Paractinoplanes abujensis]|uniref:Uncharacterized protein YdhG (YjbR/CyaY superfamily) n=1 Tax=Paractinoplanes abujensis TaxID=882441 RepID=A0A7W7CTX1_9ACTN|nr:DUF1801 domain-containing protein [Actinoplanes abujensis]MBB4694635.1 uncharacterized protein YdhG (YjbR/CyaY superfamily) [Actinoplanes abujensis]GID20151.1 hypothetical protein Aab01nite_37410 [Actinoplanes abujensis]